jgi:hypothetical protein
MKRAVRWPRAWLLEALLCALVAVGVLAPVRGLEPARSS